MRKNSHNYQPIDKVNIYFLKKNNQILLDWVNTINEPRCLMVNSTKDLACGIIFLDLLKHLLIEVKNEKEYVYHIEYCCQNGKSRNRRYSLLFKILKEVLNDWDELEGILKKGKNVLYFYYLE